MSDTRLRQRWRAPRSRITTVTALVAALGLLSACAELPKPPAAKAVYDLGLPASPLADSGRLAAIELLVGAPPWAEASDMLYRLVYEDAQLRRSYAHSRWAAAPAQLLDLRWRQRLGMARVGEGGGCRLRVRVDEFSQVFAAPAASEAVLEGSALLVDGEGVVRGRLRLVQRTVAGEGAAEGARSLGEVGDAAAEELRGWLLSVAGSACLMPQ